MSMRAITTVPPGGGVKLSEVNEEKGDGIRVRTFRTGIVSFCSIDTPSYRKISVHQVL